MNYITAHTPQDARPSNEPQGSLPVAGGSVPLCIACKHYPRPGSFYAELSRKWAFGPACERTYRMVKTEDKDDLVHGGGYRIEMRTCSGCRADDSDCGPGARYFAPNAPDQRTR